MPAANSLRDLLVSRAAIKQQIRDYFAAAGVLEVDVPALGEYAVTDLHLDAIPVRVAGQRHYLQTSPEYFMKRLLSQGSGSIYSLAYAYRDGEQGSRHRPEFLMLEWYRLGWDERQLMDEVSSLLFSLGIPGSVQTFRYADIFYQVTGLNPHQTELAQIQSYAQQLSGLDFSSGLIGAEGSRSDCLDCIFTHQVEAALPEGLVFITDYPACQSALAKLDKGSDGNMVARRFEAYLNGMEIANGYNELTDAHELRQRFHADRALREARGKPDMAIDERFMAAMEKGLPACAGVALGVDRVLMQLLGHKEISQVLPIAD